MALNSARKQINCGRPKLALDLLSPIRNEVESADGSLEWVELPLLTGEALVADACADALGYLKTAKERILKMERPPLEIRIRIDEHLGHFYRSVDKRPSKAREHYVAAKRIACEGRCNEDAARVQLKICEIDLITDNDPQIVNFQSLMRLGKAEFTSENILMAWMRLTTETEELQKTTKAARNFRGAQDSYLLNLLRAARNANAQ